MNILFDFTCPEPWHIDAFEMTCTRMLKDRTYTLTRKRLLFADQVHQDFEIHAEEAVTFFEMGMIVSLIYSCIEDGSISEHFKKIKQNDTH